MNVHPLFSAIPAKRPLVHCISNIVSANDCANLLLAVGASPIMAQAPEEMAEISPKANAVVLNTGTPSEEKFLACLNAGLAANRAGIPVVLDPVGAGASQWRLAHIRRLLAKVNFSVIRLNRSEAAALLTGSQNECGVDASLAADDADAASLARALAAQLGTVVLLSGISDIITDGDTLLELSGGSDRMKAVTGAGCMLSVLCGACLAVAETPLKAAAAASQSWKAAAEKADIQSANRGMGSFHAALMDAVTQV